MLENILNLTGAQELSKKEQNSINGGQKFLYACYEGAPPPPVPSGSGLCRVNNCWRVYDCKDVCPNGTDPICRRNDW